MILRYEVPDSRAGRSSQPCFSAHVDSSGLVQFLLEMGRTRNSRREKPSIASGQSLPSHDSAVVVDTCLGRGKEKSEGRMSILRGGFLGCAIPRDDHSSAAGARPDLISRALDGKAPLRLNFHPTTRTQTSKSKEHDSRSMHLNVRTRSTSRRTGRR
jgi:hypothetical protein